MAKFKIAVIVGSNRRESDQPQAGAGAGQARRRRRFEFKFVQIDDLPLYNQDNEGDLPAASPASRPKIAAADGVLFVTPEHSRSIPAVLKNAIDWGARPWGKNSLDRQARRRHRHVAGRDRHARWRSSTCARSSAPRALLHAGGEAYMQFKPDLIDADGTVTDEEQRDS